MMDKDKNYHIRKNDSVMVIAGREKGKTGKVLRIGPKVKSLPVKKISSRSGENLYWSADSTAVGWTHGPVFYERQVKDAFDFVPDAPEKLPEPVDSGISLTFSQKADKPEGYKAIVGGNWPIRWPTMLRLRNQRTA